MATVEDFQARLLPGKYALTKSMELTKVTTSGTLWYVKKFLVFYYFIFLSNDIETRAYIHKAAQYFDRYIAALDPAVQETARKFFFPEIDAINLKSDRFTVFSAFAGKNDFTDSGEKAEYLQRAKKCYFTLLMDSGGQSGVKKYVKDALGEPGFVYSPEEMAKRILDGAIDTAVEECNEDREISDNSIKYILSPGAVQKIEELARSGQFISAENVRDLILAYPSDNPRYYAVENDMVAFIRNERQILYYYGYFHSKSSGARDDEFSSLTPVGEMALAANALEFLALWEHQKIKMISQPPTASIQKIAGLQADPGNFAVSFTPYLNILHHLRKYGNLTERDYQYIVSREDRLLAGAQWEKIEGDVFLRRQEIQAAVRGFGRRRDIAGEDAHKELMKYLLGVRGDLRHDQKTNPLSCCQCQEGAVTVEDADKLALIYPLYRKLNDYKAKKYGELFLRCEEDLRRRYAAALAGESRPVDARVKIQWDLYNIHADKLILLSVLLLLAGQRLDLPRMGRLSAQTVSFFLEQCPAILEHLGIRSKAGARDALRGVMDALAREDYSRYLETDQERAVVLARYRGESAAALLKRIQKISGQATVAREEDRARSTALVSALKSYYMARYSVGQTLPCECCGGAAFLTETGEPYVEFHHLIPFRLAYGPDHYLNLFALCPACHRKLHYLPPAEKRELYADLNRRNYFRQPFTQRLRDLKRQRLLRSYHLEYLLADGAITQEEYDAVAA